jgi:hypothetical protein
VLTAEGYDPGVVNLWARDPALRQRAPELRPVLFTLGQDDQGRRLEPSFDLVERRLERRGRGEDPGVRDDGQELVNARPGDRPWSPRAGQLADPSVRGLVPRGILPVGVD